MDQQTDRAVIKPIVVNNSEFELIMELLEFVRTHNFGTLTVNLKTSAASKVVLLDLTREKRIDLTVTNESEYN